MLCLFCRFSALKVSVRYSLAVQPANGWGVTTHRPYPLAPIHRFITSKIANGINLAIFSNKLKLFVPSVHDHVFRLPCAYVEILYCSALLQKRRMHYIYIEHYNPSSIVPLMLNTFFLYIAHTCTTLYYCESYSSLSD